MAIKAVQEKDVSVALSCRAFMISESCYRYDRTLSDENADIADWLVRLTTAHRTWGFGLCFLYLRNVKGFVWNHKRVRRIYCDLELNLRIRPRKRLVRERPEPLAVPDQPNTTWSMDFMSDQLADGRNFRTLDLLHKSGEWFMITFGGFYEHETEAFYTRLSPRGCAVKL